MTDYAVNDAEYADLERERRRLSETQHRLLVAALRAEDGSVVGRLKSVFGLPLAQDEVAPAMGLERRGLVITRRATKPGFSLRPRYAKGSVRHYSLTPKGRALAETLPALAVPKLDVQIRPGQMPQILVRKDGEIAGTARYCPPLGAVNAGDVGDGLSDQEWAQVAERVREYMRGSR